MREYHIRRDNALGDVLFTTPALQAFREQHPDDKIYFYCHGWIQPLFEGLSFVDGVRVSQPGRVYDYDLTDSYERYYSMKEWIHPTFAYAKTLGVDPKIDYYSIGPISFESKQCTNLINTVNKIVAVVLRSRREKANYSSASFREIFDSLPNVTFVLLDESRNPYIEIRAGIQPTDIYNLPNVINLTGQLNLKEVAAVFDKCDLCLGCDTGTTYVANALHKPIISLIGGSAGWARAPLKGIVRMFQGSAPCFPCSAYMNHCPVDHPHCLSVITPTQVVNSINSILY